MRKNTSGFAHILLILGILVVGAVVLIFGKDKLSKFVQIGGSPSPIATEIPLSELGNIPAGWKKYSFDEIKLTFSAPSELSVQGEAVNGNSFTIYIQNNESNIEKYYQLYVIAQWEPKYTQVQLDELKAELEPSTIKSISIDGNYGVRGQIKGQRNRFVTYFIKDGALYSAFTSQPTSTNEELSNQILSTFKFSEAAPSSTSVPVTLKVPSDWKQYTATDPGWGIKTTLSLPESFTFSFSGSEFNLFNGGQVAVDQIESWDYISSIQGKEDGTGVNTYTGGSRREWYQKYFDDNQGQSGNKILGFTEKNVGGVSYLEVLVEQNVGYPSKKINTTRYLHLQNNIIHVLSPMSDVAYSGNSVIAKNIPQIFLSLSSIDLN